ncbi:PadR family transcriptional regulator [Cryobacterium sp. TMT1-3]|uniref:PadR family transcriptional regulator n=1 Tax=Cryobacterium luteum TaxID=1424661 RepID=A0A1H8EPN5_9MICO|nr:MULTISPECIES: PadR family transcriptional regulator [Cryobacterium]TFB85782.1 PadR family transcriptional regulator [Cryobacterium luteum]TFC31381.1 PadR family transcriptional regulator [Cryobacterium sp. TMT1-3]SEN21356.1 transcriptional regulator, PadR family [Cryobacterium luteum]
MGAKQWSSDWMRAALGLCVLRTLAAGPTYGYAIAAELEERGFGTIKGGTLYPLLTRYDAAGWISVEWRVGAGGPERKYLSLTNTGLDELATQTANWRDFTDTVLAHLDSTLTSGTALTMGTDKS